MDSLRTTQERLHALLRGEQSPEAVSGALGCDPGRLTVYRDFVRGHVLSVVEKNHPLTWALLGDAAPELAADYYREHPATSWELNRAAEGFADFLEARSEGGALPSFAVALARFEWECFAAFVDEARIPPPEARPRTGPNPTLRALHFDYPVVRWVLDHDARPDGESLPPLPEALEQPEMVFVFRHPLKEVASYYRASDNLLFALKVVLEQIPLEDAARESNQSLEAAEGLVRRAAEIGLVLAPA